MSETILIRPASPEADIADPAHNFARLPYREEGVEVPRDPYWVGHLQRGDVVLVEPAAPVLVEPSSPPTPAPVHD